MLPRLAAQDRQGSVGAPRYRSCPVPRAGRLPGLATPAGSARTSSSRPPGAREADRRGLPTEATIAQVLVSKFADRLPLYRQAQIYARQGVRLDRSTLADWAGRAAFHLRPLHERLLALLRASPKLFADETTAPVLDPGRGRTKTGQFWAYAATIDPGAAPIRRPSSTSTHPILRPSGQSIISPASVASCRSLCRLS